MAKILVSLCLIAFSLFFVTESKHSLKVVTVNFAPYVYYNNGSFEGFYVELINEIIAITGHTIENMYTSPDRYYGHKSYNGTWNGMIGEVIKHNADIIIGDLTITKEREEAVAFTVPVLSTGISAFMKKYDAMKIKSWSDLASQTDIMYGMIVSGSTHSFFKHSINPIVKKMYAYLSKNPRCYSLSTAQGIKRIINEDYILIGESLTFEYIAGRMCELTLIDDQNLNEISYGIAMAKDSPDLSAFNDAINYLKFNGKIDELKQKYWKSYCN